MSETPSIVAQGSLTNLKQLVKLLRAQDLEAQIVAPPDAKLNS